MRPRIGPLVTPARLTAESAFPWYVLVLIGYYMYMIGLRIATDMAGWWAREQIVLVTVLLAGFAIFVEVIRAIRTELLIAGPHKKLHLIEAMLSTEPIGILAVCALMGQAAKVASPRDW